MRVHEVPQLPHRIVTLAYELCVVPGCGVKSLSLDAWGMCPTKLWDWAHEEYADNAHRVREGISTERGTRL